MQTAEAEPKPPHATMLGEFVMPLHVTRMAQAIASASRKRRASEQRSQGSIELRLLD
jgi:hypothetical protein